MPSLQRPQRSHSKSEGGTATTSPRYRTRSTARSASFSERLSPMPSSQKDDHQPLRSSPEYDDVFFSPGKIHRAALENPFSPVLDASDAELSPIAKHRDSNESCAAESALSSARLSPEANGFEGNELTAHTQASSHGSATKILAVHSTGQDLESTAMPDLTSARQQVDHSSNVFIERIRNAAHLRKVAMTRSRDSLVAKEEEQLRCNAEIKDKARASAVNQHHSIAPHLTDNQDSFAGAPRGKMFKARPLPPTTGAVGSGGLEGVPKVEKKPTTTPFSPLLGARRPQKPKIKCLRQPNRTKTIRPVEFSPRKPDVPALKPEKSHTEDPRPFKARVVPKVIRSANNGGQHGVPKVEKRPSTLALSPKLGPRRRSCSANARLPAETNKVLPDSSRNSRLTRSSSVSHTSWSSASTDRKHPLQGKSPILVGLQLVTTPRAETPGESENNTPTNSQSWGYEPYSTRRARQRAEYDIRRKTMFELKSALEIQDREREVRRIQRELNLLRKDL